MKKSTTLKTTCLTLLASVVCASAFADSTNAPPLTDEQTRSLLKRLDELEQEVKILQRNREVEHEAAADKATNTPTVSLGLNGLTVRSADSNFVMTARGYVQADGRNYIGNKTTPDTFLFRRVRPILEGTVWQNINYRLMLDLGAGNVSGSTANNVNILDDAYVNVRFWQQAQIQIGKFKSPVGLERAQSTADLFFIETGFATALTPNYDLGVAIHNDIYNTTFGYSLGLFDGASDGGSIDNDVDEGKDIAGRVFIQPFFATEVEPLRNLGFGVGGSFGPHTAGTLANYKTPGQQTFYAYSANVSAGGDQYRIDPQAYYFLGSFGIMGEYILSSQRLKTTGAGGMPPQVRFNNTAWQVEATWFLTGEQNSFKTISYQHVVPRHRFVLGEDGWGAFEIVARAQQLSLDQNSFQRFGTATFVNAGSAQQATAFGGGLNWYLNGNLKLDLNYEYTSFHGATAGAAGAIVTSGQPEHVVLSQVQFSF